MEEADSSEMLALLYQITRRHIPGDRNFNYSLLIEKALESVRRGKPKNNWKKYIANEKCVSLL
jgi:hypothetical protein